MTKRWILALFAGMATACSGTAGDLDAPDCAPGDIVACECADFAIGQRTCNASLAFNACNCGSDVSVANATPTGDTKTATSGEATVTIPPPASASQDDGDRPVSGSALVPGDAPVGGDDEATTENAEGDDDESLGNGALPGDEDGPSEDELPQDDQGGTELPEGAEASTPLGLVEPVVPPVTADCPTFADSSVTFMGLAGIEIVAGEKPPGPTAPMVFYWHGTGGSSDEFNRMASPVRDGVLAEGGVLISFQGTTGGDLSSGTLVFGVGDFELTDQLLACAVRDHNIDPRRVYTTGCSAGGLFAAAMAATRSNYIAAAAPNSGGWVTPAQWQGDYTPPLMTIHGAPGQDVVIVDFSDTSATADQAFQARGGFVINCNHGGGHCGGNALQDSIWEFFLAHPYGVDPSPWASGLPAGFASSCEIY